MIDFTLRRTSTASIEAIFDTMTDHRRLAEHVWMFRRSTLDKEGTPAPNGVGAVRRLVVIGPPFVEEIVEYQRPTRWAYTLLSGAPIRDHLGTIDLRETGNETEVSWHIRATVKVPGIDRLMLPVFKQFIDTLLRAAIAAAEAPRHPERDSNVIGR